MCILNIWFSVVDHIHKNTGTYGTVSRKCLLRWYFYLPPYKSNLNNDDFWGINHCLSGSAPFKNLIFFANKWLVFHGKTTKIREMWVEIFFPANFRRVVATTYHKNWRQMRQNSLCNDERWYSGEDQTCLSIIKFAGFVQGAKVQTKSIFNICKEKQNRYTLLYYVTFWTEITMGGEADRKVTILSLI